jgi:hypothetical protein
MYSNQNRIAEGEASHIPSRHFWKVGLGDKIQLPKAIRNLGAGRNGDHR